MLALGKCNSARPGTHPWCLRLCSPPCALTVSPSVPSLLCPALRRGRRARAKGRDDGQQARKPEHRCARRRLRHPEAPISTFSSSCLGDKPGRSAGKSRLPSVHASVVRRSGTSPTPRGQAANQHMRLMSHAPAVSPPAVAPRSLSISHACTFRVDTLRAKLFAPTSLPCGDVAIGPPVVRRTRRHKNGAVCPPSSRTTLLRDAAQSDAPGSFPVLPQLRHLLASHRRQNAPSPHLISPPCRLTACMPFSGRAPVASAGRNAHGGTPFTCRARAPQRTPLFVAPLPASVASTSPSRRHRGTT